MDIFENKRVVFRKIVFNGEEIEFPSFLDKESAEQLVKDPKERALLCNRLRHGLNSDCCGAIFAYLPFEQLMELSYMSEFFCDVFREHLSSKYSILFNLNDGPFSAVQIFELLGKRIRRLKIVDHTESVTSKLEKYLRLMIAHCEKDTLIELHLDLGKRGSKCDQNIIDESMAYLTEINRLKIETPRVFFDYEDFLVRLSKMATNLQCLEFNGIYWKGSWSTLSAWTT